jgi:Kdo2-lipid IVA lauroyltransferase/acyltransferase
MTLVFKCLSWLPLWLAHGMGAALGWVVFALSPTYRRRFLANTRQAGYRFGQVVGAVAQTGRMVAEIPKLWTSDHGKPQSQPANGKRVPFEWDQASTITCIEAAYKKGKGVIFLTPHLGCFEIVAQALALQFSAQHGPLTVLYRPARKAWMAQLVANSRDRPGLIAVPTNLFGVRQMIKALRKGEAVGLLPDQVPPDGMGLWSGFFGKDAYTMTLAARLAAQTGATVLVGWGRRLPWGRGYEIHFHEIDQGLDGDLTTAVQRMNAEMEALIRVCPSQYLWGYGRYKQPRVESKEAVKEVKDVVS